MKKTIITSIIATLLIIIAIFAGIVMATSSKTKKIQDQLQLGQKYLDELNYEQAVATFLAVIDIDEKSVEAYIGAAKAYVGLSDYESAISILEKGIAITEDKGLSDLLSEIKAEYEKIQLSAEETMEEQESQEEQILSEEAKSEILRPLYEALTAEEYETAGSLMNSEEIKNLVIMLRNSNDFCYYYLVSGDENNGVAIRVDIDGSFYCGNIVDGKMNGEGKIAILDDDDDGLDYRVFSGNFQDDIANGQFIVYQRSGTAELPTTSISEGNVENGYYEGAWKETETYDDGAEIQYNYQCNNGKPKAIRRDENNESGIIYCEGVSTDGVKVSVSISENVIFTIPTATK